MNCNDLQIHKKIHDLFKKVVKILKKLFCISFVFLALALNGCSNVNVTHPSQIKKEKEFAIDIMTTNKFLYNMTKVIVKDNQYVDYMFNDTQNQWDFSFTEDSVQNIGNQDLFIYSGSGFEPWIGDFLDKLGKDKVGAIDASRGIAAQSLGETIKYKNTNVTQNPYYWLDVNNYKIALSNIKNAIEDKDPERREIYESNFNESLKIVDFADKDLKVLCDKYKNCTFLVDGDKLDYFTKYYNLKTIKFYNDKVSQKADADKLSSQLKDKKNLIFLYSSAADIALDSGLLKQYNMGAIKIMNYDTEITFNELLSQNTTSMQIYLNNNSIDIVK